MKLTNRLYRSFLRNVKFTKGSCWMWRGPRTGPGYGYFNWGGVGHRAHRLAITLFLDPNYDPDGRGHSGDLATHDCDVKLCVSPYCLRIGTSHSNIQEAYARGKIDLGKKSAVMIGNQRALGYKHAEETRRKMSMILRGRKLSEEHRRKLREAMVGNQNGHGNRGRKLSKEHRRKISSAMRSFHER